MQGAPLALTMGEPAGIGGEITLKTWLARIEAETPVFFAIDDPLRLKSLAARLRWDVPIRAIDAPSQAAAVFAMALPVLPLPVSVPLRLGAPDPSLAEAVLLSIATAVGFAQSRQASAVVTNPIHKSVLMESGFKHSGHTEFLGELAGGDVSPVMMLTACGLCVVPVTIHIPISEVPKRLTTEAIILHGRVLAQSLKRDFSVLSPRIAVAGLNPHAGEDGMLGDEEQTIIRPAVEALIALGVDAFGPLPADTLFHEEARGKYDAVLCMYHDQALIPVKMLGFWEGVNVTLGLPFVRTSPDHGTALDLAGTGKADHRSLLAAMKLANRMADARAAAA